LENTGCCRIESVTEDKLGQMGERRQERWICPRAVAEHEARRVACSADYFGRSKVLM
jgi:hypothetical protein